MPFQDEIECRFAQKLNAADRKARRSFLDVKGRLWRKLFKEVVESSQPSAGQKWSKLAVQMPSYFLAC